MPSRSREHGRSGRAVGATGALGWEEQRVGAARDLLSCPDLTTSERVTLDELLPSWGFSFWTTMSRAALRFWKLMDAPCTLLSEAA